MPQSSIETTKVQERGVVTLPRRVREKLGTRKGSTIAFVETPDGKIEVRTLEAEAIAALDQIGTALKEKGVTIEQWMKEGSDMRRSLLGKLYKIDASRA